MARYVLKIACACDKKLCTNAVHVLSSQGGYKTRIVISGQEGILGVVVLKRKEAEELGRWFLDLPAPVSAKRKKFAGTYPWQS